MSDAFDRMGIEARFDLDVDLLEARLLALLSDSHPDRAGIDDDLQWQLTETSAQIQADYRRLIDPQERANLLLERLGVDDPESRPTPAPARLMAMMELREAVEAAAGAGNQAELDRHLADVGREREALLCDLAERFGGLQELGAGAVEAQDSPDVEAIRIKLSELRYLDRLVEAIQHRE